MIRHIALFLALALCALGGEPVLAPSIDTPLVFKDLVAIRAFFSSPEPAVIHPHLLEAEGYIFQYAYHDFNSKAGKEELYVHLVNGATARQLMLFGFSLRLEVLRRSRLEDEARIAAKVPFSAEETFEESVKLYTHRIQESRGREQFCEDVILELIMPNAEGTLK